MSNGVVKIAKIILAITSAAVIAAGTWHWWHCGSVGSDIHQSTDSTMADIKRTNESARGELRDSESILKEQKSTSKELLDAVGRSEESAGFNTERTDQLAELISESRRLAQENQRIIRDVEAVNRERTKDI